MTDPDSDQRPTLMQVIGSVLAAGLGVQSNKNRKRDFTHGSGAQFVMVGLIAAVAFSLTIYLVVKLVLRPAA